MSYREKSEIRDGMRIDWDMPITANDGLVLRCGGFRPIKPGRYPVLLSYGPYGKWLHFEDGYKTAWDRMVQKHPSVAAGSTCKYQSWEVCDPEKWVPDGYVCVRVDSRRCGRSAGYADASGARPATSSTGRRARPRTSATASNGPARSRGRTAKSGSPASRITRSTSGRW